MKIAPSILSADFSKLGESIKKAEAAGADIIHLDIMDGHFVPNLTFGQAVSKMSKSMTSLPHDAHLMVTNPEDYFEPLASYGIEYISFHLEIDGYRKDLGPNRWVYVVDKIEDTTRITDNLKKIRSLGVKAGLTVNPPTEFELFEPFLDKIDLLLLMSVNPGFSGQGFISSVYDKLEKANKYRAKTGLNFEIMIDGGVGMDNTEKLISLGADILVSGSSFFQSTEFQAFIRKIKAQK